MERPKQRLAEPELEMPKLRQMREKLASVPTVNNCSQLSLFERTFFTSKVALLRQCDSKARATWSRFKDLFKKDN